MQIRVKSVDLYVDDCRTRLPFRFGITTMTSAPLLTARVRIETEAGQTADGFSADLLVPKWFEKSPQKSAREDCMALIASASAAGDRYGQSSDGAQTAFEHWWRVYRERVNGTAQDAPDRLVRGFGVALVERAVLDATCRAAGRSFFEALREDLFGFRPAAVLPELDGWSLADQLPARPAQSVQLRHTVGLADPIRTAVITDGERVADGLPQSLEENIARYGLSIFKIKLGGTHAQDLERLLDVADLVASGSSGGVRWTADGNEQFEDLGDLLVLLDALGEHESGRRLLEGLLYLEQPLPRARSFDEGQATHLAAVAERVPVILDEADHGIEAFPRGLELGYSGVSVKNCKGVFRALINSGICAVRGKGAFQSGEDLTNLAVLPLQQDLASVAALGLPHVERNGHHYFHGLDHLPAREVRQALSAHPDLYEPLGGGASLRIVDGALDLRSIQTVGYGHAMDIQVADRTPLEEWSFAEPTR